MKVGLIGFVGSGKSTLYRAAARGQAKGDVTAVPVPDERFDTIVAQVKPKKATPTTVIFHDDLDGIRSDSPKKCTQKFLDSARKMDLLLHVVCAFESPMFPDADPVRDQKNVDEEFLLIDMQIVENRLEKLKKSLTVKNPGTRDYLEKVLFEKLLESLSEGTPIRRLDFTEDDQEILKGYQFLSAKPCIVAFNVNESECSKYPEKLTKRIEELKADGDMGFCISCTIEEEIAQLESDDQKEFLESLGLTEPASSRVIQVIYDTLGLITFFTAGEGETRAWPLRKGSTALKAADNIHSDIARGFIRAEIIHYEDWLECGSSDAANQKGKMKLEGKEYVILDGDLLNIRNKS